MWPFKRDKEIVLAKAPVPKERVSVDNTISMRSLIRMASEQLSIVNPKIPLEFLEIIEKLCLTNPDFGQALNNTIRLGNTGHEITVDAGRDSIIKEASERLKKLAARINTDQLINKLFRQVAVNGAISLEWVAEKDLSGIDKVVLVPVKDIRFKYDNKEDRYKPHQYDSIHNKYIELNEVTYHYSAIETSDNSPYGIPPFLSALGNAVIQLFMMGNIKFIIQKLGLLGFISVMLKAESVPQNQGETTEAYTARLSTYLNDLAKNMSENYRDGLMAHLDNMEIEHHNVGGDARGAKDLLQMNEEQIASGLKQDPALLGRSYSTTETYAGVVYAMMLRQLENYQMIIKRAIEQGYKIDLLLQNIPVDDVSIHFKPGIELNPKESAESESIRVETVLNKMDAGIIGPDDAARELGYKEAYMSDFRPDTGEEEEEDDDDNA